MTDSDKRLPIILASSSPRRIELLRQLNMRFSVIPSNVEEFVDPDMPVNRIVKENALAKAGNVAERLGTGLVIGADTVVVCEGEIFGKPDDLDDAKRILKRLVGTSHKVWSGVAVVDAGSGSSETDHAVTTVTFRHLSESQIDAYFEMINPLDKAGAYAIQGAGGIIVEEISGCYYNVVGLPLTVLDDLLARFGVRLL